MNLFNVLTDRPVDPESAAAKFIADTKHEETHDRLVWGMRMHRDEAARQIPGWEELRELASQIKEHTLTHLDQYLEQFEQNAIAHGVHVHWALDAAEHNDIVLSIFQKHNVKRVIKSKSMLQEECGMAAALETQGIEVRESDLGERIQQLAHERPSHIVVPAIHQLRTDVAALFAKNLATDEQNSDPHYLTEAMRNDARPALLHADAGMTGANFAIAETGGIVICTNEGNADIGVTVPDLQVCSIGIEKLVPRSADLGVMLRLLSRSALGTPMTQYTTHLHRPRPGTRIHFILVDNKRSDRLASPDFWHALKCIRCGACMNTCPVYRRSGGLSYQATYSGPIGVILDPGFDHTKYRELPYHSTLCGSCSEVCPVRIDIADQIYKWRRVIADEGLLPLAKRAGMAVMGETLSHTEAFHGAEAVAIKAIEQLPGVVFNNPLNPWTKHRDMPNPPKQTFHQWYQKNRGSE
ncbi:putative L-lactate dehydrogenase, Iron-sulfur cluster-binding subunit YkgF [Acidisarcina polymorpha]|uniref:Putative L-lactate dehydrogenase, Iron-sulfur cluster-binding subunit YkgF n=1 Tax=Acidisarcina polymorpha TaxID=2211140 RepID=A0A2Z5G3D1_9BACT|nr:lactate utilization protein B [Acidisarcina polymorpha]AXC13631.1 putative L-lactate dehydrogenase, Iron-sulfur cluster-binding subunit YkgF [Acidisarcina polymorpha]